MLTTDTTRQRIKQILDDLSPEVLAEVEQLLESLVNKTGREVPLPTEEAAVERLLADMREQGVLAEPTAEVLAQIEEWQAMPEQQRDATIQELRNLRLNPPLSEVITRLRGGEFIG